MVKNPKPFYDSIEEKENDVIRLKKAIKAERKEFYDMGFKDGYQKARDEEIERKTQNFVIFMDSPGRKY